MIRFVFSLVLSLSLAFGSVTLAAAQVDAVGQTTLTICSDGAAVSVTLDAQGNPVPASHHHCPDCLMGLSVGLVPAEARVDRPLGQANRAQFITKQRLVGAALNIPQARGPPSLI